MHLFDIHDNIKKYNTALDILNEFYKIRLNKYDERKKLLLELLKLDLDIQENKFRWLKLILDGTIDLRTMDIDKIISYLVANKFSTKDKSYDYLLNMSIKDMSKDNIKRLEEKIKNIKKYIKDLKNTSIQDLWRSDLNDLRRLLEK
jgi:DNA topoisomerase-2